MNFTIFFRFDSVSIISPSMDFFRFDQPSNARPISVRLKTLENHRSTMQQLTQKVLKSFDFASSSAA
jgi:hypothetical protein